MPVPERYQPARLLILDEVMELEWIADLGQWLFSQRESFRRGGTEDGRGRFNYELENVDDRFSALGELKRVLSENADEAAEIAAVEPLEVESVECHASLYHHGSHFNWHKDRDGYEDEPEETQRRAQSRWLSFCFYLHAEPPMFSGGELEFLDGTQIEPKHNRLVMFDPQQPHRVRRVECWSSEFLHGRWAIAGWLHSGGEQ